MKILKNILLTLGVLFILLIGAITYFGYTAAQNSSEFLVQKETFIRTFSEDLSRNWDKNDVFEHLSENLIAQIESPNGQATFRFFRQLGEVTSMSDFVMTKYFSGTGGVTAVITYNAEFQNASGSVTITLVEKAGELSVEGFHISIPEGIQPTSKSQEI